MAFYKDYSKDKKKKDYAALGSFADEGANYRRSGRSKPGQRPDGTSQGSSAGRETREGKPYGAPAPRKEFRPAGSKTTYRPKQEGAPGEKRPYSRPAADGNRPYSRPASEEKRPYGRPAADGNRPYGRPASDEGRSYGRPAPDKRRSFTPRPIEEEKRSFARPAPRRDASPAPARSSEPAYKQFEYRPASPVSHTPVTEELTPNENLLSGRNPIREAIKSGRDIEKLLVAKGDLSGSAREIVMMAKEARIPVQEVERARLDEITRHHQGMLAFASAYQYATVEDMLAEAKEKNEAPFLILLDGITDPHNLGAIIRTAECAGAHGVIVPERRSVGLTPAAVKASAGAVEHVKVARVTNLTRTLSELKEAGLWITAAVMEGEPYQKANFTGPVALVIGAEGEGISRLVLEQCDHKVSLPLKGEIGSLNASVAAGILMYAVLEDRSK